MYGVPPQGHLQGQTRDITVYNGIFSATPHVSCVQFENIHEICPVISIKETDLNLVMYW